MNKIFPGLVAAFAMAGTIALAVAPAVRAGTHVGASPWVETEYARIRLIRGAFRPDGGQWLGVHIEMEPGWVTYWRNPGYSGVPPRFDWSQSTNLAEAQVRWPAPRRLKSDYGVSYGYLDQVVFPVLVSPGTLGKDIEIRLKIDYAVCREICIPEFSELELVLPAAGPDAEQAGQDLQRLIADFEARVPEAQSAQTGLRIETARIEMRSGNPVLAVTAALGGSTAGAELFVEGPEEYYFTVPDGPEDLGGGKGLFVVAIEGAKAVEELTGARLGGTLVTPGGATEYWWTVR